MSKWVIMVDVPSMYSNRISASDIVRCICAKRGGSGGGRANFAQAGDHGDINDINAITHACIHELLECL